MIVHLKKPFSIFLRDLNLKQKLLLSYLMLIVLPLGILAWLTNARSSEAISKKMLEVSSQALEQVNLSLDYTFQSMAKSSNIVYLNSKIQQILQKDKTSYDVGDQIDDFSDLSEYFSGIQFDQNVHRIRLYINDGLLYSQEDVNFFNIKSMAGSELYEKAVSLNGQIYWTAPYNFKYGGIDDAHDIISGIRMIGNREAYGEFLGIISIDVLVSKIEEDVLKKSTINENGFVYILNERNQVIASSNNELLKGMLNEPRRSELPPKELSWEKMSLSGGPVYTAYKTIPHTRWKLAAVIPVSNILKSNAEIRDHTFILMAVIGLAAYMLALLVSGSMVKRIRLLMKTMQKAEKGDFSASIHVSGSDEIGELETKFNHMLVKIESLVEEKYQIGKEAKNAELKALQAQINPHFLYNTLELITCKAYNYKARDIVDLVNSMARFYKLSLSKGKDIVSIGDEIAHNEAYINIQNQRFDDSIRLVIDIDERLTACSIMKLVLQPLVENAIHHGIMEKEIQAGTIKIGGIFSDDDIVLTVADDGVGMSPGQTDKILTEQCSKDAHGFGVINVDRRLKINYGEKYGLTYKSIQGQGTTVSVRIPAEKFQA